MPVIARFFGITIKMYLRQKNTIRHISMQFTVIIQDYFQLKAVEMYEGDIPSKEQKLIKLFISNYREKLYDMWETQNFTSLKFEGGASYGSQSAKCIND